MDTLLRVFVLSLPFCPVPGYEQSVRSPRNHDVSVGLDKVPGLLERFEWEFGEFCYDRCHLRHNLRFVVVVVDLVAFLRFVFCWFRRRDGGRRGDRFGVEDFVFNCLSLFGLLLCFRGT